MKKNKLLIAFASLSLLFGVGLAACGGGSQEGGEEQKSQESGSKASSQQLPAIVVSSQDGSKKVIFGQTLQLVAKVNDAVIDGVSWESKKADIATVSQTGLVTPVAKGSVQILAKKDGYKDGTFNLTVDYESITVTVKEGDKTSLLVGETTHLLADKQNVTWTSDATDVAEVDQTGLVTAKKIGTAIITASGTNLNSGSQEIKVVRPEPTAVLHMEDADHYSADGEWTSNSRGPGETPVYTPSSGEPSDDTCIAYFGAGDKETLSFTCNKDVKAEVIIMIGYYYSITDLTTIYDVKFNNEVVALPAQGYVSEGTSGYSYKEMTLGELNLINGTNKLEITMKETSDNRYPYMDDVNIYAAEPATIAVVLPEAKPAVTVNQTNLEIAECQVAKITSTMTDLTFKSNNTSIASVDANGLVRGVGAGETTISVSKDGYSTIKVPVKVNEDENAFVVGVEGIQGDGIEHRDSQNISGDHKHMIESMEVNAVGTIAFTAPSIGAYHLVLRTRASGGYNSTSVDNLATCMTLKINGITLDLTGEVKGSSFNNYYLGEVILDKTDCEIEITCLTAVPQMNLFRFVPNPLA